MSEFVEITNDILPGMKYKALYEPYRDTLPIREREERKGNLVLIIEVLNIISEYIDLF